MREQIEMEEVFENEELFAAELEADMDDVDAASARLRDWTIATCGESSSMLFELLTGMGS